MDANDTQRRRMKTESMEGVDDLISNLPDSLLYSILSLLPVQEAIRTSVLSRRWENLWTFIPHLDFNLRKIFYNHYYYYYEDYHDQTKEEDLEREKSCAIIDKVLLSHQCHLTSCRIKHCWKDCESGQVQKWVQILTQIKSIQELTLVCQIFSFHNSLDLPAGMFNWRSLRVLELNSYVLKDASPFEGCVNLETLKLIWVIIGDETLSRVVLNCLLLKKLSLCYCRGLKKLKICDQNNLKFLELQGLSVEDIDIHAMGLTVLVLDTVLCYPNRLVINTPNLSVFQAYHEKPSYLSFTEILSRCSGLLAMESQYGDLLGLYDYPPMSHQHQFKTLQVLSTSLDAGVIHQFREIVLLSLIFRVCIQLQKLYITVQVDKSSEFPYPEFAFWDKKELYDSLSHHLRVVYIRGFRGTERETRFISHLISKAPKLKTIVINCDDNCSREGAIATEGLLSLPRASLDVSIVLKPGKMYFPKVGDHFENWISTLK